MASTNQTTNYGLPLYSGTDKASWIDTNAGFEAIDTALKSAVDNAESATENISQLTEDLGDTDGAVATLQNKVATLEESDSAQDTAILNLGNRVTALEGGHTLVAEVVADGVKTRSQLYNELYAAAVAAGIVPSDRLVFETNNEGSIFVSYYPDNGIIQGSSCVAVTDPAIFIDTHQFKASGSDRLRGYVTSGGFGVNSMGAQVVTSGLKYEIYKLN